jgi:hypothetical protein
MHISPLPETEGLYRTSTKAMMASRIPCPNSRYQPMIIPRAFHIGRFLFGDNSQNTRSARQAFVGNRVAGTILEWDDGRQLAGTSQWDRRMARIHFRRLRRKASLYGGLRWRDPGIRCAQPLTRLNSGGSRMDIAQNEPGRALQSVPNRARRNQVQTGDESTRDSLSN